MQAADIEQFQRLLIAMRPGKSVPFDLRDVTLVNQDAVTFLAHCEADGITLSGVLSMSETDRSEKRRNKQRQSKNRDT